jgi:hypothetical protein
MKSRILCSPSPGTNASEKIKVKSFHSESLLARSIIYFFNAIESRCINSVPGVMTLESNLNSFGLASAKFILSAHSALISALRIVSSSASRAALNLRARYWFIFALGATPSIAK